MIFGILGGHDPLGFENFLLEMRLLMVDSLLFRYLLAAGFSFQGTELLGITAGETDDPGKTFR